MTIGECDVICWNEWVRIKMDDEAIEKLAREEILSEAKRGAARAEIVGPQGWEKCPVPQPNKTFLQNTLFNAVGSNNITSKKKDKLKQSSDDDDDELYKFKHRRSYHGTKSTDRKKREAESKEKRKIKDTASSKNAKKSRHD